MLNAIAAAFQGAKAYLTIVRTMAKEIELSKGLQAIVDDDDYEVISAHKWYAHSDTRGKTYAATRIMGDLVYMHRLILDSEDDKKIDHINGNGLDNRKENLRATSALENSRNKSKQKNTSSKYKGVTKVSNGWKAHISINNKDIHIGYFKTEDDAARAYDSRAIEEFGEHAKLNFDAEDNTVQSKRGNQAHLSR